MLKQQSGPKQQRVYVVDDDQGMLESTVWLLESIGLQGIPCTSGREFLECCDPDTPACVLLDIRMPGMGGLNVQEAMQARGLDLPVIFVSGHADVPIVVRAFKSGASDFIEKPFNEQLLLESVQQALARHSEHLHRQQGLRSFRQRLDSLTPRERDILLPLVQGYTSREIADQLAISVKTVDLYRSRIMKRMQTNTLTELVSIACVVGVIDPLNPVKHGAPVNAAEEYL